jgi:hypothetical protein
MYEKVIDETLEMAKQLKLSPEKLRKVVDDLRDLRKLSSHAERQLAVALGKTAKALGVSKKLCGNCPHFFKELAKHRKSGMVIVDPKDVWVFLANGRYAQLPRKAVQAILNTPDAAEKLRALLRAKGAI